MGAHRGERTYPILSGQADGSTCARSPVRRSPTARPPLWFFAPFRSKAGLSAVLTWGFAARRRAKHAYLSAERLGSGDPEEGTELIGRTRSRHSPGVQPSPAAELRTPNSSLIQLVISREACVRSLPSSTVTRKPLQSPLGPTLVIRTPAGSRSMIR